MKVGTSPVLPEEKGLGEAAGASKEERGADVSVLAKLVPKRRLQMISEFPTAFGIAD